MTSLFLAARQLSETDRAQFLTATCDPAIRSEVEAMLRVDCSESLIAKEPKAALMQTTIPERLRRDEQQDLSMIGREVAGFRILGLLGRGGMGAVFEAEQAAPQRRVAMKVLRSDRVALDEARRRFRIEVEAQGRMHHPGIARALLAGTFEHEGTESLFLAMELVEGARNVLDYATEEGLDDRECARFCADVCDAVHHGHLNGFIHRDLSPANILVDCEGRPKVIDFGMARVLDHDAERATIATQGHAIVGTLDFMSPEQCAPQDQEVDTRTDVYSLGAVLFRLITGEPPHALTGLPLREAIVEIARGSRRRVSHLRPNVSKDLDAIVDQATAASKEERYSSVRELADDLRRYLAGVPTLARPPSWWGRMCSWVGTHPYRSVAVAALLFVVLTAGLGYAALQFLMLAPSHVEVATSTDVVRLYSRGGYLLRTWDRVPGRNLLHAEFVEEALADGSDRVVLFYNGRGGPTDRQRMGQAEVFDPEEPDLRVWSTADAPVEFPTIRPVGWRSQADNVYWSLLHQVVDDLLPEQPGREFLTVHRLENYGLCAIRVYDFEGHLCFDAWHEGWIKSVYRDPVTGLVLFSGLNSEYTWEQRGAQHPDAYYPTVVFALDLEAPVVAGDPELLTSRGELASYVDWYRWLGPLPELLALGRHSIRVRLGPPTGAYAHEGSHAYALLDLDDGSGWRFTGSYWILDLTSGQHVDRVRPNYRTHGDIEPSVSELRFVSLHDLPESVDGWASEN